MTPLTGGGHRVVATDIVEELPIDELPVSIAVNHNTVFELGPPFSPTTADDPAPRWHLLPRDLPILFVSL